MSDQQPEPIKPLTPELEARLKDAWKTHSADLFGRKLIADDHLLQRGIQQVFEGYMPIFYKSIQASEAAIKFASVSDADEKQAQTCQDEIAAYTSQAYHALCGKNYGVQSFNPLGPKGLDPELAHGTMGAIILRTTRTFKEVCGDHHVTVPRSAIMSMATNLNANRR
jgi:hypothetical protein